MNKIFEFKGSPITFNKENSVMINATEMAKPFGKLVKDWLKTEQSVRMINAIAEGKNLLSADLVIVKKGGDDKMSQGTWMHEDVALVFAQWLSPQFYVWCNNKIKELLTTGSTSLNVPQTFAQALRLAAEQQEEIERQQLQLEMQRPKVEYYNGLAEYKSATFFIV